MESHCILGGMIVMLVPSVGIVEGVVTRARGSGGSASCVMLASEGLSASFRNCFGILRNAVLVSTYRIVGKHWASYRDAGTGLWIRVVTG
jgi:L-cysteine desulfidase